MCGQVFAEGGFEGCQTIGAVDQLEGFLSPSLPAAGTQRTIMFHADKFVLPSLQSDSATWVLHHSE
jgi:hypothetical protein